jgi:ABC-type transport system substrate-binding protein
VEPLGPYDPPRVGGYALRGRLGMGGMGRVFLGQGADGVRVAVKIMHDTLVQDPEFRSRFRREIQAARQVSGPFTADVVDADPDAERPWLATEFVDGPALDRAIATGGPMPTADVLKLATGLAEALSAIHAAGVVHRDLKPSNVLMSPDGPRVIDFGIARALDGTKVTLTGSTIGTPGFMSPEQVRGEEPHPAGDVFALGAVLHFAATAQNPFGPGSAHALMYRVVNEEPDLAALEPGPLRDLVAACLAKDPRRRPLPGQISGRQDAGTVPIPPWGSPADTTAKLSDAPTQRTDDPPTTRTPPPTPGLEPATALTMPPTGLRDRLLGGGLRRRAGAAVLAVSLVGAGGVAAWNGLDDGPDRSGAQTTGTRDITIRLGHEVEPASYNTVTLAGGQQQNVAVMNLLQRGFTRVRPDGAVEDDKDFGTVQKISDRPLRVRYTIDPRATWSDGTPVTCDDAVLTWLASANRHDGFDPKTTVGYELQEVPACTSGDKQFTVTYQEPFADWRKPYGATSILPAHVVVKEARLDRSLPELAADPTDAELERITAFWIKGWELKATNLKRDRLPSNGPYELGDWEPGTSLTLRANPRWWGRPPRAREIEIAFAPGEQLVEMLRRREVDVISPASTNAPTLLPRLRRIDGVGVQTDETALSEHFVFNFNGPFADRRLREAFARCVGREKLVRELIMPSHPQAEVLQTRIVLPTEDGYREVAETSGGADFADDVTGRAASELLEQAGRRDIRIRVGRTGNQAAASGDRRGQVVGLVQAGCGGVGFRVEDAADPNFYSTGLRAGSTTWDVALLPWVAQPGTTNADELFHSASGRHGLYNYGSYSNPEVDRLLDRLGADLDGTQRDELVRELEQKLWEDLPTLPLYSLPDIAAFGPGVRGVQLNPNDAGLTWNAADWDLT